MTDHVTIRLTPAARRWAMEHGGAITLRQSLRHGCCGGRVRVPVAEIGTPNDPAEFIEEVVDEVRIFRYAALTNDERSPITIDLAGLWRWRALVIRGIEITTDHEKAS